MNQAHQALANNTVAGYVLRVRFIGAGYTQWTFADGSWIRKDHQTGKRTAL